MTACSSPCSAHQHPGLPTQILVMFHDVKNSILQED